MARGIVVTVLSTVMAVAFIGLLGTQLSALPAAAVSPSWHTTASYTPVPNVSAVSCAPSTSASSATCVAVGNDGGHVASIIVTQNGGSTWSDSTPPSGVTTLSTVSCPSASVCYAGGGSGIMKSTNGGASWVNSRCGLSGRIDFVLHGIDEHARRSVDSGIVPRQQTGSHTWDSQTPPSGTSNSLSMMFPAPTRSTTCRCGQDVVDYIAPQLSALKTVVTSWTTLDQQLLT